MGEKQSHKRKTTRKAETHNGILVFFVSVSSEMFNIVDSTEPMQAAIKNLPGI